MSEKLKNITVFEDDKIRDVLVKINKNGFNGVFVNDKKNKLVGVITDSDVRKNLLKNKLNVNSKAITITQKKFIKIPASKVEDSKKILLQSNKMLLPIIEKNKLIDFIHASDLFQQKSKKKFGDRWIRYIGSILVQDLLSLNYHVNILDINYYGCHFDKKTL